jgi:hypothetical protein
MAGKTRKTTGKDKRGGKRPGAGRKELPPPDPALVAFTITKIKEWAEKEGRHIDDILLAFAYGQQEAGWKLTTADRLKAIEMLKKYTVPTKSEKDVKIKTDIGPTIGLPPVRTDPAKIIPIDGGKKG